MAVAGYARLVGLDVVDDRVIMVGRDTARHFVELERLAHAPGDVVIGAGRIAAGAEAADHVLAVIERETAAEHDHAAEMLADQRILRAAGLGRIAAIEHGGVDRIAHRQAEQRTRRLRASIEVGRRNCEFLQAERIGGIRFLSGDGAAAEPLVVRLGAAESDRAYRAFARDDSSPFVVVETAISRPAAWLDALLEGIDQLVMSHRTVGSTRR